MSTASRTARIPTALTVALILLGLLCSLLPASMARGEDGPGHLVISEVVTGGASASDELIELYNPSTVTLPLEGLELIYVSASGGTVSRRAAWPAGAAPIPPGHHVLVANELGIYAGIADATYASGMAATGGSVALLIQGAATAIDAVGWGTAANAWTEGAAAPAPPAGSSLERLPGGAAGSTRDTHNNAADFTIRDVPDPQNSGSAPVPDPAATPTPTTPAPTPAVPPQPSGTPAATPLSTPVPTGPAPLSVAAARAAPDGTSVTIEGVALTGSNFTDGGGYVADATGGIAVIVTDGTFARGDRLRLRGSLDDRFAQRTLRVAGSDVVVVGAGEEPAPTAVPTGNVGEALEGVLARITGTILSAPTSLSSGLAFEVDDGSGAVRVLVATASAIDTTTWTRGSVVTVTGVVGQRDSSGSGAAGYRVQPRDAADVGAVTGPSDAPSPSAGASASAEPSPTPTPDAGMASIADARRSPKNTRVRVRGVVTLPSGLVDPTTAVIQDGTGAIALRLGEEAGSLVRGTSVEVRGTRSTKSGMETLRVTEPARRLGSAAEPAPRTLRTGDAAEAHEAMLVVVRGALTASARRSSSGSVSFEIDDGSGALRVHAPAALSFDDADLVAGAWVEVRGVLGQETTGSQPLRGYRVWPRSAGDVRILAAPGDGTDGGGESEGSGGSDAGGGGAAPNGGLDDVGTGPADGELRVGATLVVGPWRELGVGGLLWDGTEVVALEAADGPRVTALAGTSLPRAVELVGLRRTGATVAGLAVVTLGPGPEALQVTTRPPHPPTAELPADGAPARWVALVGRLVRAGAGERLVVAGGPSVSVERRCTDPEPAPRAQVTVRGFSSGARPQRIVAPCGALDPAPALGVGRASPAGKAGESPDGGVAAGVSMAADAPPASAAPAAMLLGSAALLLGGTAAWLRRRPSGPDPEQVDDPAGQVHDAVPEGPEEPATAPVLTLLPVRRERGP